eukprot:GHVH01003694.1.p1 GENE.GHVH01003694.1~~GHVH01003694.1.p1  ORF type:complete len:240 (+),score=29.59 GHVH01003694.1:518-1237(+)
MKKGVGARNEEKGDSDRDYIRVNMHQEYLDMIRSNHSDDAKADIFRSINEQMAMLGQDLSETYYDVFKLDPVIQKDWNSYKDEMKFRMGISDNVKDLTSMLIDSTKKSKPDRRNVTSTLQTALDAVNKPPVMGNDDQERSRHFGFTNNTFVQRELGSIGVSADVDQTVTPSSQLDYANQSRLSLRPTYEVDPTGFASMCRVISEGKDFKKNTSSFNPYSFIDPKMKVSDKHSINTNSVN